MKSTYRFLEHTADVGIEITSPTLEEIYKTAGEALFMLIAPEASKSVVNCAIESEGDDPAALLVNFMNDLLLRFEVDGLLFRKIDIKKLTSNRLEAMASCEAMDPDSSKVETVVKAVTWHGLKLEEKDGEWRSVVYLDL
jgi:SHS2 domain-containing protein